MVYSAVSYRRWVGNFTQTLKLTFSKNELSLFEIDDVEKKSMIKTLLIRLHQQLNLQQNKNEVNFK